MVKASADLSKCRSRCARLAWDDLWARCGEALGRLRLLEHRTVDEVHQELLGRLEPLG
jgi:hypothetical protein